MSQQRPHFSPYCKAKTIIKGQISGKLVTSSISSVAIVSVNSEKTCLKKIVMISIIISMNKIARIDGFWRAPEIDFRYETKARKVMVDFKFDALYR